MQVLGNRILVVPDKMEEKTVGGIILPGQQGQTKTTGMVESVGKGRLLQDGSYAPLEVKVGDRILFEKFAGTPLVFDGKDYMIMAEQDVLAIL